MKINMDNFNEGDQGGKMMTPEEIKNFFKNHLEEKKEITEEYWKALEVKSKKAQKLVNEIDKIGESIDRKAFMIAMEYGHLSLGDEALLKIMEEAIEKEDYEYAACIHNFLIRRNKKED